MCLFCNAQARTCDRKNSVLAMQEVDLPLRYCDQRVQALQLDAMQLAAGHLEHAKAAAGACSELQRFHVVLSDMCHSMLGVAAADVARSLHLARCAAGIAIGHSTLDGERSYLQICAVTCMPHMWTELPCGAYGSQLITWCMQLSVQA